MEFVGDLGCDDWPYRLSCGSGDRRFHNHSSIWRQKRGCKPHRNRSGAFFHRDYTDNSGCLCRQHIAITRYWHIQRRHHARRYQLAHVPKLESICGDGCEQWHSSWRCAWNCDGYCVARFGADVVPGHDLECCSAIHHCDSGIRDNGCRQRAAIHRYGPIQRWQHSELDINCGVELFIHRGGFD